MLSKPETIAYNSEPSEYFYAMDFGHFSPKSIVFNEDERMKIKDINDMISSPSDREFNKGLLIAFYYSIPNNTMPLIWKDGFSYIDQQKNQKKWYALLPRKYG